MIVHLDLEERRKLKTERLFDMVQSALNQRSKISQAYPLPGQSLLAMMLPQAFHDVASAYLSMLACFGGSWESLPGLEPIPDKSGPGIDGGARVVSRVKICITRGKPLEPHHPRSYAVALHYQHAHCCIPLNRPRAAPPLFLGSACTPDMQAREYVLDELYNSAQLLLRACRKPLSPFSRVILAAIDYQMCPQVWFPETKPDTYGRDSKLFPDITYSATDYGASVQIGERLYRAPPAIDADLDETGVRLLHHAAAAELQTA